MTTFRPKHTHTCHILTLSFVLYYTYHLFYVFDLSFIRPKFTFSSYFCLKSSLLYLRPKDDAHDDYSGGSEVDRRASEVMDISSMMHRQEQGQRQGHEGSQQFVPSFNSPIVDDGEASTTLSPLSRKDPSTSFTPIKILYTDTSATENTSTKWIKDIIAGVDAHTVGAMEWANDDQTGTSNCTILLNRNNLYTPLHPLFTPIHPL